MDAVLSFISFLFFILLLLLTSSRSSCRSKSSLGAFLEAGRFLVEVAFWNGFGGSLLGGARVLCAGVGCALCGFSALMGEKYSLLERKAGTCALASIIAWSAAAANGRAAAV